MGITDQYKTNFKNMIKDVFQDQKGEKDSKQMYDTVVRMAEIQQSTEFITPEETFIISNEEAKDV